MRTTVAIDDDVLDEVRARIAGEQLARRVHVLLEGHDLAPPPRAVAGHDDPGSGVVDAIDVHVAVMRMSDKPICFAFRETM